ncbi:MAG: transcriptional regulator [Xanthomonadales bacterium PRO6]|nr:hypothetical protein [Xanthomonadales bacterium]MCE7932778.1 transcriptional regulator [Xanthomonadales bacterium PRO6]
MATPAPRKNTSLEDWHPADIIASLRKAGWSLAQLALHHGYADKSAVRTAVSRPYPKAERIIAAALGLHPMQIWPSRYDRAGQPNRTGSRRPIRPANAPRPSVADMALPRNTQKRAA